MSQQIEHLTIAYMAIGAKDALRAHQAAGAELSEHSFDGELDFIDRVVSHASTIEALSNGRDFSGVFVYEVAEPFGHAVAKLLLEGNFDGKAYSDLAEKLVAECGGSDPASVEMSYPKVVVLCFNSDGSPEFHQCTPQVTQQQMNEGAHYDLAKENAGFNGFVEPMIAFDATDVASTQLGVISVWL